MYSAILVLDDDDADDDEGLQEETEERARERESGREKNASFCHTYLISIDRMAKRKRKTSRERRKREPKGMACSLLLFGLAIPACSVLSILGSFEPS